MYTGAPNMVFSLMKKCNLYKDKKNAKVTKRNCLIFLRETPGIFLNHYLQMIDIYAYEQPHFFLLRKNVIAKDRNIAPRFGDIKTTRDYA